MQNFVQYAPTEVIFGKGTENETGAAVKKWGGSRVLLVYGGGSAVRSGLLGRVEESLKKEGIIWEEFGGVKPNPRLSFAEEWDPQSHCLRRGFYPGSGRRQRH